ncbi:MAG: hypothetical protein Kow0075_04040 [Salibacteraceae bacterium]
MFQKVNQILMFVFIGLGVILMIMTMRTEIPAEGECTSCGVIGNFIGLSYVLLILAVVAALGGTVMTAITNPKKMVGTAIGIGVMVLIVGVSYALASDEVLKSYGDFTPSVSRWTGAGLYTFYILFLLAVASIGYSSVSRMLK